MREGDTIGGLSLSLYLSLPLSLSLGFFPRKQIPTITSHRLSFAIETFAMRFGVSHLHISRPCFRILLCFFVLASPFAVVAVTNPQDVNALKALHTAWSSVPSWDTSTDPCDDAWLGVRCDQSTKTRVVQLILINQRLNGTLAAEIGDLNNLTDLDLSSNPSLRGSLPTEIGKLSNLRKLFVQFCSLSGPIPSEIGNLTNLAFLGLTNNALTGPVPENIGLLTKMVWLDLSSNSLTGSLPVSTSNVNGIGLDNLTTAEHFHLQNNSFSGSIPTAIFNKQMQLLHLLLHNNSFSGNISSSFGNLVNVKIVRFDFNQLNGSIPSTVNTMQNLTTLDLSNNALTGLLPDFSKNTKLQILQLGNNQFDVSTVPTWITSLTNLRLISLQSANLSGTIPTGLFGLPEISNVTLSSNNLNGTLNLTAASSTLLTVDVRNNSISGLDKGVYAQELLLDGNTYCNNNQNVCSNAQSPAPSPNVVLAGSTCTNGCPAEYAINPKVSGNCKCARPVLGNVTFVASELAFLSAYNVTLIEEQLTDIGLNPYLAIVGLNFNYSQVVVDAIASNKIIVSVFPPTSTETWQPNDAGEIAYVLKNQNVQFTDIGPLICEFSGTPYDNGVVKVNGLSTGAKIGIGVGVAALLAVIAVIAVYAAKQRKRADKAETQNKPFAAWIAASEGNNNPNIPQLKGARWFSLAEIGKCTNNYSQSNEIGEGGYGKVYKGYLLSGERVAIKRAGANSKQGAPEFKTEVELLSRVHHKNLVGLIGFCFEEGEQMLVYEFMSNGTLRDCLAGQSGIHMDWDRRIAFALGSARGIAYLHNEANPPIIHRDIKSNNILLDDKLVPKVADFGLSKLVPKDDGSTPWSAEVKGTLGYLDPDYFMTNRLTEKSDVYSYGVVLLELITGRLPIQGGKYVVRETRMALEHGGMASVMQNLVDPNLTQYPPEEMEKLVLLSLRCVEDKTDKRPSMAEVVKELETFVQEPHSSVMEIEMGDARTELYAEGSPYMRGFPSSSFEASGSYVGRPGDSGQRLLPRD